MDLPELFKAFLVSQKKPASKVTVKNYLADFNQFVRWYEKTYQKAFHPSLFTPDVIKTYIDHHSNSELAKRSLNRKLSTLRKLSSFLQETGSIIHSPFDFGNQQSTVNNQDSYHLQEFKNELFNSKASSLTIKNYINDVKQFIDWSAKAYPRTDDIFTSINSDALHEYRNRLMHQSGLSAVSINRKLSSLRRYTAFLDAKGLVHNTPLVSNIKPINPQHPTQANANEADSMRLKNDDLGFKKEAQAQSVVEDQALNQNTHKSNIVNLKSTNPTYSKFPPLRLLQKLGLLATLGFDLTVVAASALILEKLHYLAWIAMGKQVFTASAKSGLGLSSRLKYLSSFQDKLPTAHVINPLGGNIHKEFYAPAKISLAHLPFHKKAWFHVRHTRPNWYRKYHELPAVHYFHFAALIIIMSAIGFGLYNSVVENAQKNQTLAATPPNAPPRILSFQGRLTDSSDNPISTAKDLRFGIYSSPTSSGSALLWQETQVVTPDQDGIFSVLLGSSTSIPASVFTDQTGLYLGITVQSDSELTPRQQIATVAFAANSETLQGLLPITAAGATQQNVVLALDSSGNLTIGGSANPTFSATGGSFTLAGKVLNLNTTAGSNGNVSVTPDGRGLILLNKPIQNDTNNNNVTTARGAVEIDDMLAVLATSSGQSAFTLNQAGAGPIFSASSSGTAKFSINNTGVITANNYGAGVAQFDANGVLSSSALSLSGSLVTGVLGSANGGTGANLSSAAQGSVPYFSSTGVMSALAPGTSGYVLTTQGAGANPIWTPASGLGTNYWQLNNNVIAPALLPDDLAVGGNATSSAVFQVFALANGSTPAGTATMSGNLVLNSAASIQTTKNQTLTLGGNTTGNIILNPTASNRVGIGSTAPGYLLDVSGGSGIVGQFSGRVIGGNAVNSNEFVTLSQLTGGTGQYWQRLANALSPSNITDDVLIGGTATASAKIRLGGTTNATSFFNTGGNVGIGTTSPIALLDLRGTSGDPSLSADTYNIFNIKTATTPELAFGGYSGAPYAMWMQVKRTSSDGTSWPLAIQPLGGNVGIGTSAPGAQLQVNQVDQATPGMRIVMGAQNINTSAFDVISNGSPVASISANADSGILRVGYRSSLSSNGGNWVQLGAPSSNPITTINRSATSKDISYRLQTAGANYWDLGITGADATNNLSLFYNSSKFLTVNTSGNVGIGTSSPSYRFQVQVPSTGGSIAFNQAGSIGSQIVFNTQGAAINNYGGSNELMEFDVPTSGSFIWGINGSEISRFNSNGNLGIGSTSPAYKLDVSGGSGIVGQFSGRVIGGNAVNSNEFVTLSQLTGGTGQYWQLNSNSLSPSNSTYDVLFGSTATTSAKFALLSQAGGTPVASAAGNFIVMPYTSGASQLGGNVGIGTTNVSHTKLEVFGGDIFVQNGAASAVRFGGGNGNTTARVIANGANGALNLDYNLFDSTGTFSIRSGSANTTRLFINSLGNVGISTTTPMGLFQVAGSTTSTQGQALVQINQTGSADIFTASQAGTTKFVINNAGNVGIGSTIPGYLLDVSGGSGIVAQFSGRVKGADAVNSNEFATLGQISGGAGQYWQRALGALSPTNITDDVLIGGTATSSALIKFTGTSGGNSFINTGNLGIGTTAPGNLLDIGSFATNATVSASINSNTSKNTQLKFREQDDTFGASILYEGTDNQLQLRTYNGDSQGTAALVLSRSSGNIAIGTTSTSSFKVRVAGSVGPSVDDTYDLGSSSFRWRDLYLGPASLHLGTDLNEATIGYDITNNYIQLDSDGNGTPEMVLTDGGNLGLGTTNPSSFKLQVAGHTGPNATNTYDLGSSSLQWRNVYGQNFYQNGVLVNLTNYWQLNNNIVSPSNSTYDLAVGGTATSSAAFQVFALTNGSVPAGTASMSGNLVLNSAASIQTTKNQTLTLGGTTTGNIVLNPTGTNNVGIGTTTPAQPLEVAAANPIIRLNDISGGTQIDWEFGDGVNGVSNKFSLRDVTNNTMILTAVNTTGNVGIGSTSPNQKLDVAGSGVFSGSVGIGSTAPISPLQVVGSAGSGQSIEVDNGEIKFRGDGNAHFSLLNTVGVFSIANTSSNASTGTAGTDLLTIRSNGNVGIGSTLPGYKLDVNGSTNTTSLYLNGSQVTSTATELNYLDGTTVTAGGVIYGNGTYLANTGAGTAGYVLQSNGASAPTWVPASGVGTNYWQLNSNVLAPALLPNDLTIGGNSSSSAKFHVFALANGSITAGTASTSGDLTFGAAATQNINVLGNQRLDFRTSPGGDAGLTAKMTLLGNGNLGIGTTSPAEKLDVAGNINTGTSGNKIILYRNGSTDALQDFLRGDSSNSGDVFLSSRERINFYLDSDNTGTGQYFRILNNGTPGGGTEVFRVADTGNVGIATTTVTSRLNLPDGTTAAEGIAFGSDVSLYRGTSNRLDLATGDSFNVVSGDYQVGATTVINSSRVHLASNGSAASPAFTFSSDTNTGIFGNGSDILGFATAGSERARFDANGNLGIGSTLPGAKVDIVSAGTTTNGLQLTANSLTTGYAASLSSTSTALTTGGLLNLDWSPGSSTIATGDLLSLNVGANGSLGNIFNVKDNGSSVFAVSQSQITANLPASFTAPGDTSFAYDINFTNPTASYIKSAAPLYIQAGETFNSSDLTLSTYNQGNVIIDSDALQVNNAATISGALTLETMTTNNGVLYTNASGRVAQSDTPSTNECLTFNGTSPVWDACSTGGGITGSGTTNYVPKFTGTSSIGNSTIFDNGNVGIGTTNPTRKLTVSAATANLATFQSTGANGAGIFIDNAAGGNQSYLSLLDAGSTKFQIGKQTNNTFFLYDNANGKDIIETSTGGNLLLQPVSGNVGIGTATPAFKLAVEGSTTGNALAALNQTTAGADIFTASASGTTRFVIANNGNVGIGTSIPANGLDVNNTSGSVAVARFGNSSNNSGYIQLGNSGTATNNYHLGSQGDGTFQLFQGNYGTGTFRLIINGSGNVGIGTTLPGQKLDVNGSILVAGGGTIDTSSAGTLGIGTGTATTLTLGRSGQTTVFGSTAWTATPTISGLITATSGLTANGALTANNTFTLGDNGDTGSVNTSDWDISTTGVMTGISGITTDGGYTQSGSSTNYFSGNVGIGTSYNVAKLTMAGGDSSTTFTNATIALGYSTTGQYPNFIHTRHNSGTSTNNAIDFYTSDGTAAGVYPTNAVLGLSINAGNVGIGTTNVTSFGLQVAGHAGPNATNTYDLGSSSLQWRNVYGQNFYQNGSLLNLTNYWQLNSNALSPANSTYAILTGSTATTSAVVSLPGTTNKDAFFNLGTGNLGVGTTSPLYGLEVAGTTRSSSTSLSVNSNGVVTEGSTTNLLFQKSVTNLSTGVDIIGGGTKTSLGNGKYRFTSGGSGATIRLYVDLTNLTNGATYTSAVSFENNTGTVSMDWNDVSVSGGHGSSNASSGRIWGYASKATYDATYHFLDINLSASSSIDLFDEQVEAGTTMTAFVNGQRGIGDIVGRGTLNIISTQISTISGSLNIGGYATTSASLAVGYSSVKAGIGNAVFSGNVGIGTTNPTNNFYVAGGTTITGNASINNVSIVDSGAGNANINNGSFLGINADSGINFRNQAGSVTAFGINTTPTGNGVIVGDASNNAITTLSVNGQNSRGRAAFIVDQTASSNNDILAASASGTTRFVIKNNGNVGIGTTNPTQKTEIYGGNLWIHQDDDNSSTYNTLNLGEFADSPSTPLYVFKTSDASDMLDIHSNRWAASYYWTRDSSGGNKNAALLYSGSGNATTFDLFHSDTNTSTVRLNTGGDSYFNGGNLGIGSSTPTQKLDVNGYVQATRYYTSGTAGAYISGDGTGIQVSNGYLYATAAGTSFYSQNAAVFRGAISNDSGDISITDNVDISGTLNLSGNTLTSSGDLTINPTGGNVLFADTDTLQIGGVAAVAYNALSNSGGAPTNPNVTSDNDLYVQGDLDIGGTLYVGGSPLANYWQRLAGNLSPVTLNDTISATSSAGVVATFTGTRTGAGPIFLVEDQASDSSPFVINQDGNVGVGTTSPADKLVVNGVGTIRGGTDANLRVGAFDGSGELLLSGYDDAYSSFVPMRFYASEYNFLTGNVGIGSTAPGNKLVVSLGGSQIAQLNDGSSASGIWGTNIGLLSQSSQAQISSSNGPIVFFTGGTTNSMTAGTERARIDTNGNLGIGSTTPGFKLDVNGTAQVTGALTLGTQATTTAHAVRADRTITAGTGLTGGGNLTADRTLSLDYSSLIRKYTKSLSINGSTDAAGDYYDLWSIAKSEPSSVFDIDLNVVGTGIGGTRRYRVDSSYDSDIEGTGNTWRRLTPVTSSQRSSSPNHNWEVLMNVNASTITFRAVLVNAPTGGSASTNYTVNITMAEPLDYAFSGTVTALATSGTGMTVPTTFVPLRFAGTGGNVGIGSTVPTQKLDVAGNIALAANGSIDTNASGTLTIGGTTATTLTLGRSGQTTVFGSTAWTATPTISGLITATSGLTSTGTLTANGTFTANGVMNLGDGGDALTINSSAFDVSSAGAVSGATGIISSGTIQFTGVTASRALFTDASSNLTGSGASSALLNALTDETGTGVAVFGTSPAITTSLTTASTAFSLVNTTATTVNFAGGATTALNLGSATSGTVILSSLTASQFVLTNGSKGLVSSGASSALLATLTDETGTGVAVFGTSPAITTSLTTASTSFDLLNTTATTVNFAGAATGLTIGANGSGTTTIRTATTTLNGNLTLSDTKTFALGGIATQAYQAISNSGGSPTNPNVTGDNDLFVQGDLDIGGTLYVGGSQLANFWQRLAGNISPVTLNDTLSATSSAGVVATFTGTRTGAGPIFLVEDQASDSSPFVINQDGNVGIGSSTPAYNLDINGVLRASSTSNSVFGNGTTGGIQLGDGTITKTSGSGFTFDSSLRTIAGSAGSPSLTFTSDTNTGISNPSADTLVLSTAGSDRLHIDSNGNVGIGSTVPTQKLDVTGNAVFSGNVGIATTNPTFALDVPSGDFRTTNSVTRSLQRTLPTTVNNEVDIGDFTFTNGAGSLDVTVVVPSSSYSQAKHYKLPIQYNQTSNTWTIAQPISDTGAYGSNNIDLDIKVNNGTASLRLRRASGSTAGTAYVTIKQEGVGSDSFTASTSTSSVSAPTSYYTSTALTQVGGNVGIGTTNPGAKLDVAGGFLALDNGDYAATRGIRFRNTADTTTPNGGGLYEANNNIVYLQAGSANSIRIRDNSNNDKVYFDTSGGNVGIGTASPRQMLSVNGQVEGTRFVDYDNTSGTYYVDPASTNISAVLNSTVGIGLTNPLGLLNVDGAYTGKALAIFNQNGGNQAVLTASISGSTKFLVDNTGNVGIGSTSPFFKLDVAGSANTMARIFSSSGTAFNAADSAIDTTPGLLFHSAQVSGVGVVSAIIANGNTSGNYSSSLAFFTKDSTGDPVQRMVIDKVGNVGIGSTNPDAKLRVVTTADAPASIYASGPNPSLALNNTNDSITTGLYRFTSTANSLQLSQNTAAGGDFSTNTIIMTALNGGNVGIGSTSPVAKLDVNGTALFSGNVGINTTSAAYRQFVVYANNSNTNTSNMDIRQDGAGDAWMNFSLGSAGTSYSLGVNNSTSDDFMIGYNTSGPTGLSTNTRFSIASNGNVGIGTTSMIGKLHVRGQTIALGAADNTTWQIFTKRTDGANSGSDDCDGGSISESDDNTICFRPGTGTTNSAMKLYQTGDVIFLGTSNPSGNPDVAEQLPVNDASINQGDILVATDSTNVNKNRNIDNVLGTKSSQPYQSGMIGAVSTNPSVLLGLENSMSLDIHNNRVINGDMRAMVIAGRIPLKVSTINGSIHAGDLITSSSIPGVGMKATRSGYVIGRALQDFDGTTPGHAEPIACPAGTPSQISCAKIIVLLNMMWINPEIQLAESGNLNISGFNEGSFTAWAGQYQFQNKGGFAEAIIAKLTAGIVKTQQLVVNGSATFLGTIQAQTINASSLAVNSISIAGQSLHDYILAVVQNAGIGNGSTLTSPVAQISTGVISPLSEDATQTVKVKGNVHIEKTASASGDLTVDGQISAQDASIAGTLRAGHIIADTIDGLDARIASIAATNITASSAAITNITNVYNIASGSGTASGSGYLAGGQLPPNFVSDSLYTGVANIASLAADLAYVPSFSADRVSVSEGLMVFGATSLSDTSITGQLSVDGSLILSENSINVLGSTFNIQPLRQGNVAFEGGLVAIDTDGNLTVAGNAVFASDVTIGGRLAANIISPVPTSDLIIELPGDGTDTTRLAVDRPGITVKNGSGSAVLKITDVGDIIASGAALASQFQVARGVSADTSVTQTVATASAGTATIKAGQYERTVLSPYVTDKSLVYITPLTDTSGITPFVARQTAEDKENNIKGSFTVRIPVLQTKDVKVNWWIIN